LPGAAIYLRQPYRRLPVVWTLYQGEKPPTRRARLAALLLIPAIRVAGDLAKMAGYPAGWVWRLRHHPPDWRMPHPAGGGKPGPRPQNGNSPRP
jgi:hypothetical protein